MTDMIKVETKDDHVIPNERLMIILTNVLMEVEEKVFGTNENEEDFLDWLTDEIGLTEKETAILTESLHG